MTEHSPLTRSLIAQGLQPELSPHGLRAYEVVLDGHQIAVFRARGEIVTNPRTGLPMTREPTADALKEALGYAELFLAAVQSAKRGKAA